MDRLDAPRAFVAIAHAGVSQQPPDRLAYRRQRYLLRYKGLRVSCKDAWFRVQPDGSPFPAKAKSSKADAQHLLCVWDAAILDVQHEAHRCGPIRRVRAQDRRIHPGHIRPYSSVNRGLTATDE